MSKLPVDESQKPLALPRRDFLGRCAALPLALTAAAVSARSGWAAPPHEGITKLLPSPTTGPITEPKPVLPAPLPALGFWESGTGLIGGIAPSSLAEGDAHFEKCGADVLCYGNTDAVTGLAGKGQALSLNFPVTTKNGDAIPVIAWAAGDAQIASVSAITSENGSNRMQFPVSSAHTHLAFTTEFSGIVSTFALSTRTEKGAAKLQTGTYIIAGSSVGTGEAPDLTNWLWSPRTETHLGRLVSAAFHNRLPQEGGLTRLSLPDFPYMVIEVSYGTRNGMSA